MAPVRSICHGSAVDTGSPDSRHVRQRSASTIHLRRLSTPNALQPSLPPHDELEMAQNPQLGIEKDDETSSSTSAGSTFSFRRDSLGRDSRFHSTDTSVDYSHESWKEYQSMSPPRDPSPFDARHEAGYTVSSAHVDKPTRHSPPRHWASSSSASPSTSPSIMLEPHSKSSPMFQTPSQGSSGQAYWMSSSSSQDSLHFLSADTRVSVAPSPPQEHTETFPPSSSSMSKSYSHRRDASLTSACSPVVSGYSPSKSRVFRMQDPAVPVSDKQAGKRRQVYDDPPASVNLQDKEDDSKTRPRVSPLLRLLASWAEQLIPATLHRDTTRVQERLRRKNTPTKPSKRSLTTTTSSSSHSTARPRRALLLRLLWLAYVSFSILYFTRFLAGVLTSSQSTTTPVDYEPPEVAGILPVLEVRHSTNSLSRWQHTKHRLAGAYQAADAFVAAQLASWQNTKAAGDFSSESPTHNKHLGNMQSLLSLPVVSRSPHNNTAISPLTPLSNEYRFSKLSSKIDGSMHDQIEPFLFEAQEPATGGSVTACVYINDAWLSQLPEFVKRWGGPISAVYEAADSKEASKLALVAKIRQLRKSDPLVRALVDFHAVYTPYSSDLHARRARERLIQKPVGTNFQLNLARFFARTDMVWLVSDARILPSAGLRKKLNDNEHIKRLVLDQADGVVVPLFGAVRKHGEQPRVPRLVEIRSDLNMETDIDGVSIEEFDDLASNYVAGHYHSLPLPFDKWPIDVKMLIRHVATADDDDNTRASHPIFAVHDRFWESGEGPTNSARWLSGQSSTLDGRDGPATAIGKAADYHLGFYEVTDYNLHYTPSLVIGKDRQPWCTERFEYNRAVCTYQMYLQGAKLWVLPDEWAYTLESIEKGDKEKKNAADRLKSSIASRLYTKFHSEACMHYGRAFLSMGLWETERAQHLRYSCSKVLKSYGIGNQANTKTPGLVSTHTERHIKKQK